MAVRFASPTTETSLPESQIRPPPAPARPTELADTEQGGSGVLQPPPGEPIVGSKSVPAGQLWLGPAEAPGTSTTCPFASPAAPEPPLPIHEPPPE
eukprot:CAMPEP_0172793600 /NCGR_PEP_ID=MMETSP1074-20121228/209558_1 /TAXON_ID=2916 /ORGANISM="Ceratium fusus, Strain PA161109" /LENGTH=95 /DNA_ID=CAMNT_0013630673 /DNA_START=847 /DNA_END=1134 /DNA_ORIENTATION=-